MNAELIDNKNDDLSVANVARVSFGKWNKGLTERDPKLIRYLAEHKHISPFFHQRFTFKLDHSVWEDYLQSADLSDLMGFVWVLDEDFDDYYVRGSFYGWVNFLKRVEKVEKHLEETLMLYMPISLKAHNLNPIVYTLTDHTIDLYDEPKFVDASLRLTMPIFVARQMFTHRMFATNEISRRYVDNPPEFYIPDEWRGRPDGSIKQGSSGVVKKVENENIEAFYKNHVANADVAYREMLLSNVAPEQARMVLPQSMMTEVIFTGSLHDWAKVYHLRTDDHAQKEINDLMDMVNDRLSVEHGALWGHAKDQTK